VGSSFAARAAAWLVVSALLLAGCSGHRRPDDASSQLAFGVDMARRGLWSEALFSFQAAARLEPQNPRILNNLAVAYEALGEFDQALEHYKQALQIAPESREAKSNYSRFVEFYQSFRAAEKRAADAKAGQAKKAEEAAEEAAEEPAPSPKLPLPVGQPADEPRTPPTGDVATPPGTEPPVPPPPPPGDAVSLRFF
jgi:tetratricopeptide (TPR) repeat protein